MPNYILCDTADRKYLFPFTHTRPIADCRVGILTIREKWAFWLGQPSSTLTESYLAAGYPLEMGDDNIWINGSLLPDGELAGRIKQLRPGERLVQGERWLAARMPEKWSEAGLQRLTAVTYTGAVLRLTRPEHIFQWNEAALRADFDLLTRGRVSRPADASCQLNGEAVFIEEGAVVRNCVLNAEAGPIYIGKNVQVMEGSLIRGPFAAGENAVVKMGARLYGATTLGPCCVAGGEIKNSVFFGYSNKAHDGYLGDAVIGEWCNLGAGTTCSNLKNSAAPVNIWSEAEEGFYAAGEKCGTLMGDYSRTGIGALLNTGTVIGVSCNLYGGALFPRYIPGFLWGGEERWAEYIPGKAVAHAGNWMRLKNKEITKAEKQILQKIFEGTAAARQQFLNTYPK
ncbi:putative sugar nucleotidyl transferase [Compostibacter hankyongensis]|uniref:GlmU family protein n=1 Tax=Compostibacter hankyongensis TaxID=1007089 RepID=A0ABP8FQ30_9BACT